MDISLERLRRGASNLSSGAFPKLLSGLDYYAYTLVGNSTFATNTAVWSPVPGVTWPVTNISIKIPPANATSMFYRVKADYHVQP